MADTLFVDATTTVNGTPIIAAWMNDVNTNTYTILSAVAGTNAITGNAASTVTVGYPRGVAFRFIPINNNTAAVTINISGLGVRNLTKFGTDALVANDLRAGMWAYIAYDGVQFQLINPRTTDFLFPSGILPVANGGTGVAGPGLGRIINVQRFTASGTYTPTAGTTSIIVDCIAGGGGSGGCPTTTAAQQAFSTGGGGGGYSRGRFTSGFTPTLAVTVGAGGLAGTAGPGAGGVGGASSLGALITANGGNGSIAGVAGGAVTAANATTGGAASGTGSNILAVAGGDSYAALSAALGFFTGLNPGASGASYTNGYGTGAVGKYAGVSTAAPVAGFAGQAGVVIVYEYA